MARNEGRCQVCEHPSRLAIDQAILNGKSHRAIARDFNIGSGVGTDHFKADHKKISRHIERCMGEAYRAAKEADLEASGLALVNRMKHLDDVVDEVLARARKGEPMVDSDGIPLLDEEGQPRRLFRETVLLAAIREARRNTEMRAKLAGVTPEGDEGALEAAKAALASPEARRLLTQLDEALARGDQELSH